MLLFLVAMLIKRHASRTVGLLHVTLQRGVHIMEWELDLKCIKAQGPTVAPDNILNYKSYIKMNSSMMGNK